MTADLLNPMAVADRLERLRARLGADGSLLVTSLTNIRYLTGFTGSAGMLFVLPREAILLTDGRYESQAEEQVASAGAAVTISVAPAVKQRETAAAVVGDHGLQTMGLEAAHV